MFLSLSLKFQTKIAPLETHSCLSSPHTPQGYHTPVDDGDISHNLPLTPQRLSQLLTGGINNNNAPTPTSAAYTISLDGYLDPARMSIGSPPHSDTMNARNDFPSDEEESFPVFSPPPYEEAVFRRRHRRSLSSGNPIRRRSGSFRRRRSSLIPPPIPISNAVTPTTPHQWHDEQRHSLSLSPAQSHHTCNVFPDDPFFFLIIILSL
jgi:hypothetical protein